VFREKITGTTADRRELNRMLGNPGACFECGHEHGVGDRCLSFHFDPGVFEEIVASVPRARRMTFTIPRLAPSEALLPVILPPRRPMTISV